jgi:hypothetical protein
MKNRRTMKILSVILILALTLSLGMTAYAAEEKTEIVKAEIVDGAVITESSDGTKRAVDTDGTIYTKEKDGSVTQQNPDGSVVSEDSEGNCTLYRPDGSIEGKVFADGTVEEWKKCGDYSLIKTTYPESLEKPSEISFENGEGKLTWTEDGFQGTTTAPDGTEFNVSTDENEASVMTITRGDSVITGSTTSYITDDGKGGYKEAGFEASLSSSDGFKFETKADYGTGEYSISMDDGKGSKIDIEGSDGKEESEMSFSDGSYYTNKDGRSEFYDAQNGNYGKTYIDDEGNVVRECDITNNGVRFVLNDGNAEVHNTETGEYLIRNADGSIEGGNTKTGQKAVRNADGEMTLTGYDNEEKPSETPPTQEPPEESAAPPAASGGLSIDEVVGTYHVALVGTDTEGTWLLAKKGNSQIVDETGDFVYDYDPKTGIATSSYENEAGKGTTELIFTAEDGKISLSGSWRYSNEEIDETTIFNYKGTKID